MSYSFSVVAATKADVKTKIAAEMDAVVLSQPVHAADHDPAIAAASAYIDLLADPADHEQVSVSVCGYLSWLTEGSFVGSSVSVAAGIGPVTPQSA